MGPNEGEALQGISAIADIPCIFIGFTHKRCDFTARDKNIEGKQWPAPG